MRQMRHTLGISPHTGWAACVVVGGSLARPEIVANEPASFDEVLASHPRIHTAEGHFYRDVLRDACPVPVHIVAPSSLDASQVGKPALAAWSVMRKETAR